MKNSTLEKIYNYLNGVEGIDVDALRDEINDEWNRVNAKRVANRAVYEQAKSAVFNALCDVPLTVKEIFNKCKNELPENFTERKIQYAILHYWNDEVVKHDNGRSAYTYTKK